MIKNIIELLTYKMLFYCKMNSFKNTFLRVYINIKDTFSDSTPDG